jgi:hypothetical protein
LDPERVYPNKTEAKKALRQFLRANSTELARYNPGVDRLVSHVGRLHPGDGHVIKVSVKNQGNGNHILIQRSRLLAGSTVVVGSLGRLPPGAARKLAKLFEKAADIAEQS